MNTYRNQSADLLSISWDLLVQTPTIGGALTLRQEAELIVGFDYQEPIVVHTVGPWTTHSQRIFDHVFGTSTITFLRSDKQAPSSSYPQRSTLTRPDFSYYNMRRVCQLSSDLGVKPELSWAHDVRSRSQQFLNAQPGRVIVVHLRNTGVSPFDADGALWGQFLDDMALEHQDLIFVLIGDDPIPDGVVLSSSIVSASLSGLNLADQLYVSGHACGFLGLASGLCTATQFSTSPHVIIKSPLHHTAAMQEELGSEVHYPFANDNQQLWRTEQSRSSLESALQVILQA